MLYPIIIVVDDNPGYNAILPDFPGAFTAGDTLEELLANVQDCVEVHMDLGDIPPIPSDLARVMESDDAKGNTVAMVDIDMRFLDKKPKRFHLTAPQYTVKLIDDAARKAGMSRSEYLINAGLLMAKGGVPEMRKRMVDALQKLEKAS